jgi:crotonobetainyl-CoA:carnitine CoA-transferase CaiB-like acyl-CoA transferase
MKPGLTGIRVLDFGHYVAGPLAAVLLADAGASVIHVDRPGDLDETLPRTDVYLNRSKQRITLDLKEKADAATARELAATSDVVIENFRPGVMHRLGLDSATLREANDRLIFCSLPGFGATDDNAELRAWEGIVHSSVAGYRPLNEHWDPTGRNRISVADPSAPLYTPLTTTSNFAGLMGAISIVMALIARERSGSGQHIEIPLAEAFVEAYSTMLSGQTWARPRLEDNRMLQDLSHQAGDRGIFDCSPLTKFVLRLLEGAGVAAEWDRKGLIHREEASIDLDRRDEIIEQFRRLAESHPAAWWDEVATRANLPLSMARTPEEWLAAPEPYAAGTLVSLDDPVIGPVVVPGVSFELGQPAGAPRPRHRLDEDRASILSELRSRRSDVSAHDDAAHSERPLDGFSVIDITQAVAGPTAARLLADFGAAVTKIGNPTPGVTDGIVGAMHRGKRTMLMDIRSADGQRLLDQLLADADVLVTNFAPPALEAYGIGFDRASAANPNLIYCSISAYGSTGPWANRRGYENQCNAATGMASRYGSRFGWTLYQPTPINDAACGMLATFATVVALFARMGGAPGQKVGASLAQASTLHQAVHFVLDAQSANQSETVRNEYGTSAFYRMYRASDGWFFLAARDTDLTELARSLGSDAASLESKNDPGGELARSWSERFAGETRDHWMDVLRELAIAAIPVASIDEATAYLLNRGVVYYEPDLGGVAVPRPGIGAWLSETSPRAGANPAPIGSQAIEILEDLGLSKEEIEGLGDRGVVCLPDALPKVDLWN